MFKKRFSKCISILLAAVLLIGTISGLFGVSADNSVDLQSYVDAAVENGTITVSNDTTQDQYVAMLNNAFAPLVQQGYSATLDKFYKVLAKKGAVETSNISTEVLVPGEEGAVSMVAVLNNATTGDTIQQVVHTVIEPEMESYTFTTVSNTIADWSGNNTDGWKYNGGNKDKVVIPDEITKLKGVDWHSYAQIKCIVYGTGITAIPEQHWLKAEVVSYKGDVTEIGVRAFYGASSLKYFRLPDKITVLSDQAFWGCFKLESLYLPYGLTTIGYEIFTARNHTVDGLANSALADGNGYIVPEIDVPVTVTTISGASKNPWTDGNGNTVYDYGAFWGAARDTKFNFWTHCNSGTWGQYYFNSGVQTAHSSMASHIYPRAWEDSKVWAARSVCTVKEVQSLNATLSIEEVAARVAQKAAFLTKGVYTDLADVNSKSAELLANVQHTYGDATSMFGVAWENAEFTLDSNGNAVNTLVVSDVKGGTEAVAKIKVECSLGIDFDTIFDSYIPTNDATADSLKTFVESKLSGVEVEVSEFYLTRAEDGVKEVGSSYTGAVNCVLVPGEYGFVCAVIKVTKNGESQYHRINKRIDPVMHEYAFASCSNTISDWSGNNTDGWKYIGGDVDKLVIPSSITQLVSSTDNPWHNFKNIKCVVVGTGITTMPRQTYLKAEIVSFNGNVTFLDNNSFTYASNLKYMRLPDSITYIGSESFRGCSQLKSLYLPYGLEEIRNDIFVKPTDDVNDDGTLKTELGYNIPEITIPSSVTECWAGSFTGAASKTVITTLTNSNHWSWEVWKKNGTDDSFARNIYVRGYSQDGLISNAYMVNTPEYIDDMTLSEAVARASQAAYNVTSRSYDNLTEVKNDAQRILDAIRNSYTIQHLNSPVNVIWESDFAENASYYYVNVLVLSKGTEIATIPIAIPKSLDIDVQGLLDAEGFTASRTTTADDVLNAVKALPEMNGLIVDVVEFYNLAPFDGAIERGSTYAGATTEDVVLVPGTNGAVCAMVRLTAPNGITTLTDVKFTVAPNMAVYSFASVSNDFDNHWILAKDSPHTDIPDTATGYIYNGPAVEKIIVPDGITELYGGYYPNWHECGQSGQSVEPKCVVYGTGLKALPTSASLTAEVISFKEGSKITSFGNGAFYGAANLKYIRMPDTVTSLGNEAFYQCTSMTQLYLSRNLKTIGSKLFTKNASETKHNITSIVIPNGVTRFGDYAFMGAANPCEIIIPTRLGDFDKNMNAIYDSANPSWGANNIVRCHRMNQVPGSADFSFAGHLGSYLDVMGLAEATCRAMQKASEVEGTEFKGSSFAADLIATGYFGSKGFASAWKNEKWTFTETTISNEYVITKEGYSTVFPVSFTSRNGFYIESVKILNDAEFEQGGGTRQKISAVLKFSGTEAGKYENFEILEYGVIGKQVHKKLSDASFKLGYSDEYGPVKSFTNGKDKLNLITYDSDAWKSTYDVEVINIPQGGRAKEFQLAGFIKYKNASGEEEYIYTEASVCYSALELYEEFGGDSSDTYNGMSSWMYQVMN